MKLTKTQYKKLEELMLIAMESAKIPNYEFICAMLYIIENGCKLGVLPKKYGNWHIVYMRIRLHSHKKQIKNKSMEMVEIKMESSLS